MTTPTAGYDSGNAFITPADLLAGAAREVTEYYATDEAYLVDVCRTASEGLEEDCGRRLLPFYDLTETDIVTGVTIDGGGLGGGEFALGLQGALGLSEARAFGAGALVRDLWVAHYPPERQELWEFTAVSISLARPWGDSVALPADAFIGPAIDTGHVRMRLGTLAPVGTEVTITYSGGYTLGVPRALREAARWKAIKRLILDTEPEQRPGMSLAEVDSEITGHLANYAR